jgi:glucose 1-dehydrogenase
MFAVGFVRGQSGVQSFDIPRPEIRHKDEVLVRIKEVGLDGTDFGIVKNGLEDFAENRDSLVLGHEMVGVVEEIGAGVKSLVPGDVVTMTVRRGCGRCHPCHHNQSDMCMTGLFTERGIHKIDGFLTEYAVDHEQYIVRVPPAMAPVAFLTEPMSIAEKAIEQVRIIQSRFPWTCPHPDHGFMSKEWGSCKIALVIGAGPLGLLTTALLRLAGVFTYTADIMDPDSPKARLVHDMGATYIDVRNKEAKEIVRTCCTLGGLNMAIEAAGASELAINLMSYMSRGSIFVMTGIPRGDMEVDVDAAKLVRRLVRFNQVVVGSVNSNRNHFEMALKDMHEIDVRFHGMLGQMVTHRFLLKEYEKAFNSNDQGHIKTVVEVDQWGN